MRQNYFSSNVINKLICSWFSLEHQQNQRTKWLCIYVKCTPTLTNNGPRFSYVWFSLGLSICICVLKYFAPKVNTEVVHFWWALIGRTYKRSILFHLTQLKNDSSVNWFDTLFQSQLTVVQSQLTVVAASTVSFSTFRKLRQLQHFWCTTAIFQITLPSQSQFLVTWNMMHENQSQIGYSLLMYFIKNLNNALKFANTSTKNY